jgi:hypothetical protein
LLHPAHYDLDRFDSASVEQAIRKADQTPDVARIAYVAAIEAVPEIRRDETTGRELPPAPSSH